MKRVVIVGKTGSGKTILGRTLAKRIGAPHTEIDSLYWETDWQPAETAVFRQRVHYHAQQLAWVMDGNYREARDIIWGQADTLIWLDYPLWLVEWRLLKRTLRRILTRENLWNSDNYETLRGQFFSRDSLFLYAIKTHHRHRREYPTLFDNCEYSHLKVLHFRWPHQVREWLATVPQNPMPIQAPEISPW